MNSCLINPRNPDPRYQQIVNEITDLAKIQQIRVIAADTDNACATRQYSGQRVITYNPDFIWAIESQNYQAMVAVFAHEVGHHYHGHIGKLNSYDPLSYNRELEADQFAGEVMRHRNVDLSDSLGLYDLLNHEGSFTHPGSDARKSAMRDGWYAAHNHLNGENQHGERTNSQPREKSGLTLGQGLALGGLALLVIGLLGGFGGKKK